MKRESVELITTKRKEIGKKYTLTNAANSIQDALRQISSKEKKTIVIFGSLYLVGEVLSKN